MPPSSLDFLDHIEPRSTLLRTLSGRGYVYRTTDLGRLDALLMAGVVPCYAGFDAAPDGLHVGHLLTIMALRRVQQAGHRPILLLRGGRRSPGALQRYRAMLGRFLTFGNGPKDALLVDSAEWRGAGYSHVHAQDFLELARRCGARLHLGAADQWPDIQDGIDLVRSREKQRVFGLTMPILANLAPGAVWLSPEHLAPQAYWQYWRAVADQDVGLFLRLFTDLAEERIAALEWLRGAEMDRAKALLAFEATALAHGPEAAGEAATAEGAGRAEYAA